MFHIPLEDSDQEGAEQEEGVEQEEGEGQEADPLVTSPSLQQVEEWEEGRRRRRRWSPRAPHTLLRRLALMDLHLHTGGRHEVDEEENPGEEENQDSGSDVEMDQERLEPRSDDDDTNFEESEDELREEEEAEESLGNLLLMDWTGSEKEDGQNGQEGEDRQEGQDRQDGQEGQDGQDGQDGAVLLSIPVPQDEPGGATGPQEEGGSR